MSAGEWKCRVWRSGFDVDGVVERLGCDVAVSPVMAPVEVGDVDRVRK